MNDLVILVITLSGVLAAFGGYFAGVSTGMKDIEIEKLKAERDIYKQRLMEWNKDER